jgi:hypothetical protein
MRDPLFPSIGRVLAKLLKMSGTSGVLAYAILDVPQRRGLELADADAERILACRDEKMLTRLWQLAWTVASAREPWG